MVAYIYHGRDLTIEKIIVTTNATHNTVAALNSYIIGPIYMMIILSLFEREWSEVKIDCGFLGLKLTYEIRGALLNNVMAHSRDAYNTEGYVYL